MLTDSDCLSIQKACEKSRSNVVRELKRRARTTTRASYIFYSSACYANTREQPLITNWLSGICSPNLNRDCSINDIQRKNRWNSILLHSTSEKKCLESQDIKITALFTLCLCFLSLKIIILLLFLSTGKMKFFIGSDLLMRVTKNLKL